MTNLLNKSVPSSEYDRAYGAGKRSEEVWPR